MSKLITIILILISAQVIAQQDPLFSQYMFNKLAINPGYAGSKEYLTGDILYRNQWVSIDGAPKTLSASVHTPLKNAHLGLGLTFYHDQLGPSVDDGALAAFAYRILFPEGKLSFGLQAGFKHKYIDWHLIDVLTIDDPLLSGQVRKKTVPDANFGIYYSTKRYFLGLSSAHLLQNEMIVINVNGKNEFTKLIRHLYGMGGFAMPINENLVFRPSILVKFVQNTPLQLDINASFLFAGNIWFGISYRTEKAISFLTELNISKNIRIGYSYDIWLNELKAYNKGSHEIRIGFDIDQNNRRMLTPRYF